MGMRASTPPAAFLPALGIYLCAVLAVSSQEVGESELVYEFIRVDYEWPNENARQNAISTGDYIVENNVITGIKVFNEEVYVTVSRWLPGVPSTMNKVIITDEGESIMQPYPNWQMQEIDNCMAFQFTQSMEIDPYSGHMWIIDAGRRNIWTESINNCPPKLVIVDLATGEVIHRYTFPDHVLSHTTNFVNDIVLDLKNGFAYMTDAGVGASGHPGGLVAYDRRQDVAYRLEHRSMVVEPDALNMTIKGIEFTFNTPMDGIALSPDTDFIFYCPLAGFNLWRIPSSVARDPQSTPDLDLSIDLVGRKVGQSDGLTMTDKSLYFGALPDDAVYKWEYAQDMERQGEDLGTVTMETETLVAEDNAQMVWPDTFAFDEAGWLWFTANQLPLLRFDMDFDGPESNFFIWRVYTGETSYLYDLNMSRGASQLH